MAYLVYNSVSERQDMFFKGKIQELDELIQLSEIVKDKLKKSEVV